MFDDPSAIVEYELSRNEPEPTDPNGCAGCGFLLLLLIGLLIFAFVLTVFIVPK